MKGIQERELTAADLAETGRSLHAKVLELFHQGQSDEVIRPVAESLLGLFNLTSGTQYEAVRVSSCRSYPHNACPEATVKLAQIHDSYTL